MGFEPGEARDLGEHPIFDDRADPSRFLERLRAGRNDMEAAALTLAPEIGDALDTLSRTLDHRLVRMSGSGSTCFALYDDRPAARRAAALVQGARPTWWVRATALR